MNYFEYIEENTIREEINSRGGGIEIELVELLGDKYDGYRMTAYQNYLGGGLLGRVCNSFNFEVDQLPKTVKAKVGKMALELRKYFHELTNPDSEWESQTFIKNQSMPESAY